MAKGTGLIGNFKGKVGNMVGYNLKDSNNKQTQGIRVYQPVVRNPKSYAQAQQRCIMKPINDFYRALKPVISRGQEGKAYGNASRLAWLKNVMKDFNGPWLVKGSTEQWPINCMVTNGSLPSLAPSIADGGLIVIGTNASIAAAPATIGALYTAVKAIYPALQSGDQLTILAGSALNGVQLTNLTSFVLEDGATEAVTGFTVAEGALQFTDAVIGANTNFAVAIISREAANGGHLRSTQEIVFNTALAANAVYDATSSKQPAVVSYMAAGANSDWPQEALDPDFQ